MHHAPHLRLLAPPPHQLAQQLPDIQTIRLRPTPTTIHLDARRIHHDVLQACLPQMTIQPETIPTRLKAAHHPSRRLQPKRRFAQDTSSCNALKSPAAIVRSRGF
jgi:hypothetical protein